jgi:hypothetical protein
VEPHAGPPADCDGSPLRLSAMLEAIKVRISVMLNTQIA